MTQWQTGDRVILESAKLDVPDAVGTIVHLLPTGLVVRFEDEDFDRVYDYDFAARMLRAAPAESTDD